jgi:hypothetical protein
MFQTFDQESQNDDKLSSCHIDAALASQKKYTVYGSQNAVKAVNTNYLDQTNVDAVVHTQKVFSKFGSVGGRKF